MGQIMMHTALETGTLGRYCFLMESPESIDVIAAALNDVKELAYHREYRSISGSLAGETVTAVSTGMGGPSALIALEEIHKCGADTMIFIGSGYPMRPDIMPGDLIIPSGAVRMEGVSTHYLPIEYPAAPVFPVLRMLRRAAAEKGFRCFTGITVTTASLYSMADTFGGLEPPSLEAYRDIYAAGGALAADMESAVLFAGGSVSGVRIGSILTCEDTHGTDSASQDGCGFYYKAAAAAVHAMEMIIRQDREGRSS